MQNGTGHQRAWPREKLQRLALERLRAVGGSGRVAFVRGRDLFLVARDQIVNQSADAAGRRADHRAGPGAPADDHRFFFPRPLVRMRRLRLSLDDGGGLRNLVARHVVFDTHRMETIAVAQVHGMRLIRRLGRNK